MPRRTTRKERRPSRSERLKCTRTSRDVMTPGRARRADDREPDGEERDGTPREQRDRDRNREQPRALIIDAKLSHSSQRLFERGETLHGLRAAGRADPLRLRAPAPDARFGSSPATRSSGPCSPATASRLGRIPASRSIDGSHAAVASRPRPNRHPLRHWRAERRQRAHARSARHGAHRLAQRGDALESRIDRRHRLHRSAQPVDALRRRTRKAGHRPSNLEPPACRSLSRPCCRRRPRCSA